MQMQLLREGVVLHFVQRVADMTQMKGFMNAENPHLPSCDQLTSSDKTYEISVMPYAADCLSCILTHLVVDMLSCHTC